MIVSFWFLVINDISVLLFGNWPSDKQTSSLTLEYSILLLEIALILVIYFVKKHARAKELSFWLYAFGVIFFWESMTSLFTIHGALFKTFYCLLSVGAMIAGVLLKTIILVAAGGLGTALYVYWLSVSIFPNSFALPFVLTFVGLGVMLLGLLIDKVWYEHRFKNVHWYWIKRKIWKKTKKSGEMANGKENSDDDNDGNDDNDVEDGDHEDLKERLEYEERSGERTSLIHGSRVRVQRVAVATGDKSAPLLNLDHADDTNSKDTSRLIYYYNSL